MGNSCSCKDALQATVLKEETAPRQELPPPVKVEPQEKRYRPPLTRTTDNSNINLWRPSIVSNLETVHTVEKASGPSDDIDMLEEITEYSSDIDKDNTEDELGTSGKLHPHGMEMEQSLIKMQSRKCRCLSALLRRMKLRSTESTSVRPEPATENMATKACSINEDLDGEEQMEALGKEVTLPLTEVRSRKSRYIAFMMKKFGIHYSVTVINDSRVPPTAEEEAHGTRAELHEEQMTASQRDVTPPLAENPG